MCVLYDTGFHAGFFANGTFSSAHHIEGVKSINLANFTKR